MFGKAINPYEEVVAKATDSNQTDVSWDIFLTVWDKVNEDGEAGARNCVAALQKRLQHRSANVQLFSLTLAGALVNNCGPSLHREISGKAFTQSLVRLVNDRTTHDSVRKEALKSIEEWVKEHPGNGDFDLMVETYEQLKRQNHKFGSERPVEPVNPRSDEAMRREEEELQRALDESAKMADPRRGFVSSSSQPQKALPEQPNGRSSPSRDRDHGFAPPHRDSSISSQSRDERTPKRVRAIYDFEGGQGPDELPFRKGDVIRVTECVYTDWWKGELRGRTGIFPANRVEAIPEPTPADPAREAEMEAELFAKSASIDKLLTMMRQLSARGEDLADNDELADRYNECMAIAPKVVALIRKYDQKQAELREMHDKFNRAKSTYEQMVGYGVGQQGGYSAGGGYDPRANGPGQHQQGVPRGGPPQQQQSYPQQQPPAHHQQQQPYGAAYPPQAHDPERERREFEERERREYEAKWAQYERDLAAYNAAQAQLAQQQQQQQPRAVSQSQHQTPSIQPDPRAAAHSPPPGAAADQQYAPMPAVTTQPLPAAVEPVWDGRQWIYPAQHAVVQHQELAPAVSVASPLPTQGHSYPAQPYPAANGQPTAQDPARGASPSASMRSFGGIAEGMQALSVGGPGPNVAPTAAAGTASLVRHQLHDPPVASMPPQAQAVPPAPAPAPEIYATSQAPPLQAQAAPQQFYPANVAAVVAAPASAAPGPADQPAAGPTPEEMEEQARREWAEYERQKAEYDAWVAHQQAVAGAAAGPPPGP